jgi:cytoskeletal protein CcmA (bactofilin family)
MGATYTRQSSSGIVDGGVIEATDLNNEFDQLLAAFVASTGHTHDGTAAEGGPITKLLGTAITIGDGTSGTDIAVTFDGESADGVLTWMEDEDYFKFSDEVLMNSTEKLLFGDTGTYIHQSADGVLDLVSDTEIEINATTIDINGAVAMDGAITGATNITLSGELDAATLDISGNADIDGTLEADAITINGTAIGSIYGAVAGSSSIVTTGALDSGSITSGFGTIDTGSSTITTTGLITGGSLDIDNVLINGTTIGHTDDTDLITVADGALTVAGTIGSGAITSTGIVTGTGFTAGSAVLAESELELLDGLTAGTAIASKVVTTDANIDTTGQRNLTISGELDAATLDISGDADIDGTLEADAITIDGATLAETIADTVGAMVTSNTESGITVAYQDADNTLDFTIGTLNQDTTGTAAIATTVTITDNESTNEDNAIIFTAGGDVDGGNLGLESDGTLTYNPSTGKVTATGFIGTLTGNVTGNASGTAATVTTAAQSNITSLGTLTTLTVDNVIINGSTIGHTGDTDLITVASGVATVAGEVSMTTLDIGGTDVTSTAAELNMLDAVARGKIIYGNSSGATALLSPGSNTQVLTSDGTDISWSTPSGIGMGKAIAAALVFG